MTDLRYPIGKFTYSEPPTSEQRRELLGQIEQAPANLRAAVKGLSDQQLDTPYRPDGWTVRQVAHHVPDSHLNAYIRFKLPSPKTSRRSSPTPKTAGRSSPTRRPLPWKSH
jgi:hypothetical protein